LWLFWDEALVAHYQFDGNAQDASGYGNHGVEHGSLPLHLLFIVKYDKKNPISLRNRISIKGSNQ